MFPLHATLLIMCYLQLLFPSLLAHALARVYVLGAEVYPKMPRNRSKDVPEGNGPFPIMMNLGMINPRWRTYIDYLKKYTIDS